MHAMLNRPAIRIAVALAGALLASGLNLGCSPGGNFDLSKWKLQLPIGSPGSPETIESSQLQGCDGWSDYGYFYTESGDGALVMKVWRVVSLHGSEGIVR